MNTKKFIALAALIFSGTFVFLTVLDIYRTQPPAFGPISKGIYAFPETPKRSLLGIDIPLLNDILPYLPFMKTTTPYLQNVCLNGSDPSSMGAQEQLLQFIQGPCLPVVLVPGLSASKLQVNIDCETLQSENPDIFSACGWGTCNSLNILKKKPDSSYTIWIPDLVSPVSLLLEDTVNCWANLIQLQINSSDPDLTTKYTSPTGVQVVVQSTTDDNQEECGLSAEDNLLASPIQEKATTGFENMKNALIAMGYQVGLTLYGAPYDWRKTTVANGIGTILNNTIQQIYSLTGKPTIIVAHSLGNYGTLYLLNSLSTEDKQKYIANYVSLMNPLSGAPKSILGYMGADTQYYFDNSYGVNLAAWKKFLNANSGSTDVLPKDPFNYFAGEPWLQEWQSRVQLENQFNVTTPEGQASWQAVVNNGDYTYQWFPTPLEQCFEGFLNRSNQCGFFMYDWSTEPFVTVQDESFNASATGVNDLFATYVKMTDIASELFADAATNGIYKLQNPEVPVTIVYGSHLPTTKSFVWEYDPLTNVDNGLYAVPNVTNYSQGDETVPTTSSLLTALKWSWEFDNKEQAGVPNAQPVKTVEVCSIYNTRGTIYDVAEASAPYSVSSNEYIGVGCDCQPQPGNFTLGTECDHADLPSDSVLIQFVQNIVNANYMNPNFTQTGAYLLNDNALSQIASNCPSVNYGPSIYFSLLGELSDSDSDSGSDQAVDA